MDSVKFPAGRFEYSTDTKKVKPLPHKGTVSVIMNSSDEKTFTWTDNLSGKVQVQQYLFKGDASFNQVQSRNAYCLSFNSYEDKYFFWMQDVNREAWPKYAQKVNQIIEKQDVPVPAVVQPPPQPSRPQPPISSNHQQLLKKQIQKMKEQPTIGQLLNQEAVNILMQNSKSLIPLLPQSQRSEQGLLANLLSPQLRQAIERLDEVIGQNEMQGLMIEMGLDVSVLRSGHFCHDAFYSSLLQWAKRQKKD